MVWGWAEHGQLGLDSTEDQNFPQEVSFQQPTPNSDLSSTTQMAACESNVQTRVYCGSGFTFVIRNMTFKSTSEPWNCFQSFEILFMKFCKHFIQILRSGAHSFYIQKFDFSISSLWLLLLYLLPHLECHQCEIFQQTCTCFLIKQTHNRYMKLHFEVYLCVLPNPSNKWLVLLSFSLWILSSYWILNFLVYSLLLLNLTSTKSIAARHSFFSSNFSHDGDCNNMPQALVLSPMYKPNVVSLLWTKLKCLVWKCIDYLL